MARNKNETSESLIMKEALKAMRTLGGRVTRKEIKREIRDHSEEIAEERVDATKKSKKTGAEYHPFDFRFNFAIKHLITAEYIRTEDNRILELSEKGRMVELQEFDPERDVWPIVVQKDQERAVSQSEEKILPGDDPWRQALLESLTKMSPQKFELFSRGLLVHMGIDFDERIGIQYSGDGGLDGFG